MMKKNNKILWKIIFGVCTTILIMFIIFILLFDVSGSVGTIHEKPLTFLEKIIEFISMKLYIIVSLFPVYIIPLILDIYFIIISKRKIEEN